ncbi:ADP-ribosylglycohydrolase [Rhodopirellula sp. P2]|uniref:ADP-ribosylglycohydrolase n=1 Tax=Rhodopirellula sp. P2 TaxID=2127060 RepID=UPI00236822DA|nr:ADP-ribosylglycohydrolase [Rhodopirellula sp. P2]WDQ17181.1 ADP-ribosylglycohydrolase [Rhodopirellula sp. P2]
MEPTTSKDELPDHHCPVCGKQQRVFLRYPWYICNECLSLAEDGDGRRLKFGNTSASGGFCYNYPEEPELAAQICYSVICLIHRRPVLVTEARFGGVVAQPLPSSHVATKDKHGCVELTRRTIH